MKSTVLFYSKGGTAKDTARRLADQRPDTRLVDLNGPDVPAPADEERIFIGTGIYAFNLPGEVSDYIKQHQAALAKKKTWLFLHGIGSGDEYEKILTKALGTAKDCLQRPVFFLGGRADMKKQNFFIRFMLGSVAKKLGLDPKAPDNVDETKIQQLLTLNQVD